MVSLTGASLGVLISYFIVLVLLLIALILLTIAFSKASSLKSTSTKSSYATKSESIYLLILIPMAIGWSFFLYIVIDLVISLLHGAFSSKNKHKNTDEEDIGKTNQWEEKKSKYKDKKDKKDKKTKIDKVEIDNDDNNFLSVLKSFSELSIMSSMGFSLIIFFIIILIALIVVIFYAAFQAKGLNVTGYSNVYNLTLISGIVAAVSLIGMFAILYFFHKIESISKKIYNGEKTYVKKHITKATVKEIKDELNNNEKDYNEVVNAFQKLYYGKTKAVKSSSPSPTEKKKVTTTTVTKKPIIKEAAQININPVDEVGEFREDSLVTSAAPLNKETYYKSQDDMSDFKNLIDKLNGDLGTVY